MQNRPKKEKVNHNKMRIKKDSWLLNQPISHRGFHDIKSPENSMGAFIKSIKMNYAIELDVHIIKDDNLIVFHDANTYRMTGVNIKVTDLKLKDLGNLRLLKTNERIPLFKEVLKIVDGQVPLLIEIKNTSDVGKIEKELLKELNNYNGEYIIQAFNPFRLKWLRENAPHIIRGQLSGLYKNSNLNKAEKSVHKNMLSCCISRPDFVNHQIKGLNNPVIKLLRRVGYPILSWTAKDHQTYCKALKLSENVVFEGFDPKVKCD